MNLARAKSRGGVIGANIMVATKNYKDYVCAAVKAGIDLIISGAGLPLNLPEYVKNSGVKIAPIVSSEKAVKALCRFWDRYYQRVPDMVIIESPMAGGHLGFSEEQLEPFAERNPVAAARMMSSYDLEIQKLSGLPNGMGRNMRVRFRSLLPEASIRRKGPLIIYPWGHPGFRRRHPLLQRKNVMPTGHLKKLMSGRKRKMWFF